ncbi:MAG TPA: hypothetical protein VKH36_16030 [Acidimicrobiia bacterium]|nr:hypothetical protein [Acidimicrobiia bacterium]
MRAGRGALVLGAPAVLLGAAGCRPEVEYNPEGRGSAIEAIDVRGTVSPAGVFHVDETVTFADDGGTVDIAAPQGLGAVGNVAVDGAPATTTTNEFGDQEVRVDRSSAVVSFDVARAVTRYADVAVLDYPVVASPEEAVRQDPDIELTGTVTLPEAAPGPLYPHLYAGRDRKIEPRGASTVAFSSQAPIWTDGSLVLAFPSALVPAAPVQNIAFLPTFQEVQQTREVTQQATEATLGSVDRQSEIVRWIITAVAFGLPAIFWFLVVRHAVSVKLEQRREVSDVPKELSDPPDASDPAVMSVLWGDGRPDRRAVAGTALALALRKAIDIQEYGPDRLVVTVPATESGANESERLVLGGLRAEAMQEGVVEGPPVWRGRTPWWRHYRRDAVKRATSAGFVTRVLPLVDMSGAFITTAIGFALFFFTRPVVYVTLVIVAQVLGTAICLVSGRALTRSGRRHRARWGAFRRYIHRHGQLDGVGPAGIVMWGRTSRTAWSSVKPTTRRGC